MRARAFSSAILAVHHVTETPAWHPLAVSADSIRRRVEHLRRSGYRFVALSEVGAEGLPPGTLTLTADDGYAGQVMYLRPVLRELGVPWSVFVLVGRMGQENSWEVPALAPRDRHLTAEEIRFLAGEGVTIGSHGTTHRDWTRLADAELAAEIESSRACLRALSGQSVDAVAYPWGAVDRRVAEAARRAGHRRGFRLGGPRPRAPRHLDAWLLPRTGLYAPDQWGGVFTLTTLGAPAGLRALRGSLEWAGRALVGAAVAVRGSVLGG